MISAEANRIQYTVSSLGAAYSYPYYFLANADLIVVKTTVAGVDTIGVLNTDYTVTGAGVPAGGTVTVTSGFAAVGEKITIYRGAAIVQPATYPSGGQFPSATTEQSQDRLTMLIQQLDTVLDRTLRVPVTNAALGDLTLAARAGKVVGFDSAGNVSMYAITGGVVLPVSARGTANQVLVNGTSGTDLAGALTLTLPQDIGISSNVRFGKIGIGQAVSANSDLIITHSVASVTAAASVVVNGALNAPAATDLHANAFRDQTVFTGTVNADAYCSYDAQTGLAGSVNYNHFYGYQARHGYSGSGTLDVMACFACTNMGVSAGTVTKLRGFYVSNPSITGGTVAAYDGLYIDNLTATSGSTVINAINIAGANNVAMAGGQLWISANLVPASTASRLSVSYAQGSSQTGIDVMNITGTYTGSHIKFYRDFSIVQGSISQVNSTTIAFNTTSDVRLKENLRDVTGSGAIIDALRPRLFDWKNGEKDIYGFIAQEVYEVFPQAVRVGGEDKDAEPWMMEKSALIPVLLAEVKSLRARVAELEAA